VFLARGRWWGAAVTRPHLGPDVGTGAEGRGRPDGGSPPESPPGPPVGGHPRNHVWGDTNVGSAGRKRLHPVAAPMSVYEVALASLWRPGAGNYGEIGPPSWVSAYWTATEASPRRADCRWPRAPVRRVVGIISPLIVLRARRPVRRVPDDFRYSSTPWQPRKAYGVELWTAGAGALPEGRVGAAGDGHRRSTQHPNTRRGGAARLGHLRCSTSRPQGGAQLFPGGPNARYWARRVPHRRAAGGRRGASMLTGNNSRGGGWLGSEPYLRRPGETGGEVSFLQEMKRKPVYKGRTPAWSTHRRGGPLVAGGDPGRGPPMGAEASVQMGKNNMGWMHDNGEIRGP